MRVLVTGGIGYIGSHTCVQLLQNGHDVIILDNLCNSKRSVLPVIERLGGKHPTFVEGDIRNEALMTEILHDHAIDTVIHFAGLKAVGESVQKPLEYYDNNVNGTLRLISAMRAANVKNFIFSSSATVYGDQPKIPYVESFPTGTPQSPYGKSKLMVEQILTDLQKAQPDWSIALLRYFNPVGAHPSGDMGEDPQGIPNNLMPYIAQVAVGRRDSLAIFGNDYPTEDGTGVRDYIHVMDLADGHVVAMEKLANSTKDRAENLMIVDLMRNDIGRVAVAGSVKVPELFVVEPFPAVHHLVSTITAQLPEQLHASDLLRAAFPGGSITGAPKVRAMEIIDELEPQRRNAWCGSIGYLSFCGNMDTSITIRTLTAINGQIYCSAGGGIVADSQEEAEYQETFDKVNKILRQLEK